MYNIYYTILVSCNYKVPQQLGQSWLLCNLGTPYVSKFVTLLTQTEKDASRSYGVVGNTYIVQLRKFEHSIRINGQNSWINSMNKKNKWSLGHYSTVNPLLCIKFL